jgi:hypothetical protein
MQILFYSETLFKNLKYKHMCIYFKDTHEIWRFPSEIKTSQYQCHHNKNSIERSTMKNKFVL